MYYYYAEVYLVPRAAPRLRQVLQREVQRGRARPRARARNGRVAGCARSAIRSNATGTPRGLSPRTRPTRRSGTVHGRRAREGASSTTTGSLSAEVVGGDRMYPALTSVPSAPGRQIPIASKPRTRCPAGCRSTRAGRISDDARVVSDNQRDLAWHTRTSPLGFDAMGIWRPGADGTDVNAVHARARTVTGRLRRRQRVQLCVDEAPSRREAGHSSHVMNVVFPRPTRGSCPWGKDGASGGSRGSRRAKRPELPALGAGGRGGRRRGGGGARKGETGSARGGGAGENAPGGRPPALDLALEELPDLPEPGTDGGR